MHPLARRAATRSRAPLFALPALLLLAACSAPAPRAAAAALGEGAVVLDVPVAGQETGSDCGLSCLTALLGYYGDPVDAEARSRFPRERLEGEGVSAGEVRDYLRGRGYRAALVRGTLDHGHPRGLLRLLDAGLPALIELDLERTRHFVLVCGYDPERRWVLVMDPAREGVGAVPYDELEARWAPADHLMLVAAPASLLERGAPE